MSDELKRSRQGLPTIVTTIFESLGILNKGSASLSKGDLKPEDAAETMPIVKTSLNVTRVGGLAAVIAAAGAAALAIFNVDKSNDAASIVVAAYASSGFIVGAALITAAIIINADIRARATAGTDTGETARTNTAQTSSASGTAESIKSAWASAIKRLETARDKLPATGTRDAYSILWLDAKASTGFTTSLKPPDDLVDEHARMAAGQQRLCLLLEGLTLDRTSESDVQSEIKSLVTEMRSTVDNIS